MSDLVVGNIVPLGTVLHRPDEAEALHWQRWAEALDRAEEAKKETRRKEDYIKKMRGRKQHRTLARDSQSARHED